MSSIRPIRDLLAEAMRLERLPQARPLWADIPESSKADFLHRADNLIKIMDDFGLMIVRKEARHGK